MTVAQVRPVGPGDASAIERLLGHDPVAHCFVAARMGLARVDHWRLGAELWGYFVDDELRSAVHVGANLVPVQTDAAARAAFAAKLRLMPRHCASLAGPADEVLDLWRQLEPAWGPARDVRPRQPLLAMSAPSSIPPDPDVRQTRPDELDTIMPSCVAMFTEEVGVSPAVGGSTAAYRARVADLIRTGRSLVRIDDGTVVFKAEVGIVAPEACQVQGVFVPPELRGRGIAAPAMAAVVQACLTRFAPVVSLYVNDYNTAARKAYARVGFEQVGTFATVHI